MGPAKTLRALNFEDKRETLSLTELTATIDERQIGGDGKRIRHAELIFALMEMLDKRNMKAEIEPIHVRIGGASQMPNITLIQNEAAKYSVETPVEAHLVRNLTGKIQIHDLSDQYSCTGLAFNYNQLGVQLAYGMNVFACSNMSIFGENLIHSYGKNGHSIKEMFSIVGDWMDLHDKKRAINVAYMDQMRRIAADKTDVLKLMGELLVQANKSNMKQFSVEAPLNDTQVSGFAQEYIRREAKIDKFPVENMWDIYNIGTALLRPDKVHNFEPIFRQNKALGDFMINRYDLICAN